MRKQIFKLILVFIFFAGFSFPCFSQNLPTVKPEKVQMSSVRLNLINGLVEDAIEKKKMPGAVVLVGRKGKIVFRKAFGKRALVPRVEEMTVDTVFDLASLTKPIITATSIMMLVEQGKLRLSDRLGKYIPEIRDEKVKKVTIKQLLTHTSGYRPDFDLGEKWFGKKGMLKALYKEKLRYSPGEKFVYSDIGFIVLGEIFERVSKSRLDDLERFGIFKINQGTFFNKIGNRKIWNPINCSFNQIEGLTLCCQEHFCKITAPTENYRGQQNYLGSKFNGDEKEGNTILRGVVHDPTAHRMEGVAGHAGLFSNADNLALYAQMILNGGVLEGKRVLSASSVKLMTSPNIINEKGQTRGLGWDINTRFSSNRGEFFPLGSFGHTGFTGTGIWIDPLSQTFVIFLSNRVHPDGKGSIVDVRARISTIVASAILDITPTQKRDFEEKYFKNVISQFEQFYPKNSPQKPKNQNRKPVLNGIDVLEKTNFKKLEGLRVGLVTNQTGRNFKGKSTIDILYEAENFKLISLFSPEHGIRGNLDQSKIDDSVDEKTGLPIFSLYGKTRSPKPEQLTNLDALVFDIQDIGTRFYTYISTLKNILEEASKMNKKVFVLDRPNPINGRIFSGPLADADNLSFVVPHNIPVRHGMTVGEISRLLNKEKKLGANLEIIKMENWERSMWFDETGQIWVNPSPNMRSLTQATLYPGIGLLETTNLSVGRGTDTPFEIIGAPWINGQKLAGFLNKRNLEGVRFVPVIFTPVSSKFAKEDCSGINIIITDRKKFGPVKTGLEIAFALRKLFSSGWDFKNFNRLLANKRIFALIERGENLKVTDNLTKMEMAKWRLRREQFLIYR